MFLGAVMAIGVAAASPETAALEAWLRPRLSPTQLEQVVGVVGGARVVGLGEHVHARTPVRGASYCLPRRQLRWTSREQLDQLLRYALDELERPDVTFELQDLRAEGDGRWWCAVVRAEGS